MAPGNRSSLIGVQPLPVITENPDSLSPLSTPSAPQTPITPIGQRRRSLPARSPSPAQKPNGIQASYYAAAATPQERQWQPPHFPAGNPPTHMPPAAAYGRPGSYVPPPPGPRQGLYRTQSSSSGIVEKELVPPIIPLPNAEKDWFARRGGWWRVALYGFLFVLIAVGLGVGLSVGLKNKNGSSGNSSSNDSLGTTSSVPVAVGATSAGTGAVTADSSSSSSSATANTTSTVTGASATPTGKWTTA